MVVLLLVLLAVSLVITLAGFFLSARPTERDQHDQYHKRVSRERLLYEPARSRVTQHTQQRSIRATGRYPVVTQPAPHRLSRRGATAVAMSISAGRVAGRRESQPIPWKLIIVGLVSVIVLGLYGFNLVSARHGFLGYDPFSDTTFTTPTPNTGPQINYHASSALVRLGQLDPGQYNSKQQYDTWAYSACSAAAMTEVINSYGHHYRIIDILTVESRIGEITPELGLLEEAGIAHTGAKFGFDTTWGHKLNLDQIISIANSGRPVIVSWPPDRWAGGHILVVRGGNSSTVFLADSSRLNYTSMPRSRFLQLWGGFEAVMTPHQG